MLLSQRINQVLSLTLSQTHTEIFECCCVVVEQNQSVIDVIRRTKLEAEVKTEKKGGEREGNENIASERERDSEILEQKDWMH